VSEQIVYVQDTSAHVRVWYQDNNKGVSTKEHLKLNVNFRGYYGLKFLWWKNSYTDVYNC